MADTHHLDILRQGVAIWNRGMNENPDVKPDLRQANLHGDLSRINLNSADLEGTDLTGAKLIGADLSGAFGPGADFSSARLKGANFQEGRFTSARFDGANLYRAQ